MRADRRRRSLAALLALIAAGLAIDAGWIHAKAALAQTLLARSWQAASEDGGVHRPWPWADSHPVARLRMARLGIEQIVLAGDSGRSLAFGPGWAPASAAPATPGVTVISAHRDTHFTWLRELNPGDVVELDAPGRSRAYRIIDARIADSRHERLALDAHTDRLLLVTCWPFDAVTTGGPLRYIVEAQAVDRSEHQPDSGRHTLAQFP
ncbi:MAG: class GN sortase [Lysobacteraceae bacterium]|jgi:sortase A